MTLKIVSPKFFNNFEFYSCTWSGDCFIINVIPKAWFLEMGKMDEILLSSLEPYRGFSSDKWRVVTAYGSFYAENIRELKSKCELKKKQMYHRP